MRMSASSASTALGSGCCSGSFHVEGFVNHYALDSSSTAERLIFVSESLENIPAGVRARETYVFSGSDQLEEIFEIAEPGKDFELYSRSRLTRRR